MSTASHKSAVVIIPPEEVWEQIQNIRSHHDKAYSRWMPHINLVYPFVQDDKAGHNFWEAHNKIEAAVRASKIQKFKISFSKQSIGHFQHGTSCTVWLKPLLPGVMGRTPGTTTTLSDVLKCGSQPIVSQEKKPPAKSSESGKKVIKCNEKISNPESGIDALKYAFWREDDRDLRQSTSQQPCIENLQFAVWGLDDDTHSGLQENKLIKKHNDNPGRSITPPPMNDDEYMLELEGPAFTEVTTKKVANRDKQQKESDNRIDNGQDRSANDLADTTTSSDYHPSVMKLQQMIEGEYPSFTDLSTRKTSDGSEPSFKPHLTLGQVREGNAKHFMKGLQHKWTDIEFEVKEIYIISRNSAVDAFSVKKTIRLI